MMLIPTKDWSELAQHVSFALLESQQHPLSTTEILVLQGIWKQQTYSEMAHASGYSPGYFTNVVAPELFQRLAVIVKQRVTKKNCQVLLNAFINQILPVAPGGAIQATQAPPLTTPSTPPLAVVNPPSWLTYPSGAVPLDSQTYLTRQPHETLIRNEIQKPGALVRVKAPMEMGKTSLAIRICDFAHGQDLIVVNLSFEEAEQTILSDLDRCLRWLTVNITRQLALESKLDDYWDDDIGHKASCTHYFGDHILGQLDAPLLLVLDDLNALFEHPQVAQDVLGLIRSWYEKAKVSRLWQNLRLLMLHSTDVYVPLKWQHSPFNVGLPIQLEPLTLLQVQQLVQVYGLTDSWAAVAESLYALVGGHPALLNLALFELCQGKASLNCILKAAPTPCGIFSHHLQRHWAVLQAQPEICQALQWVVQHDTPVELAPTSTYKLSSMGLVQLTDDGVEIGCELYRQFFCDRLQQL